MANIIATDSSLRTTLASFDRLYVPIGVLLGTPSDYAVYGAPNTNSNSIGVDGSIVSVSTYAIYLNRRTDDDFGGHHLSIGETGIVRSVNFVAVTMNGADSWLRNSGQIAGRLHGGQFNKFDDGVIENQGGMTADSGSGIYLSGSDNVAIANSGLISGDTGISSTSGFFNLVNSGTIESTSLDGDATAIYMAFASAASIVKNSGAISSFAVAVNASGFDDKVINSGDIIGDVQLNAGADIYRASGGGGVSGRVEGGAGNDILRGAAGDDDFDGGGGRDTLRGRAGDDTLSGDKGNDLLVGGAGEDDLSGGGGSDTLYGGDQDDVLNGQAGNDWLNGGRGDDILTGAIGADTFAFNRNAGDDVIRDFANGQDKIDLTAFGLRPADYAAIVAPALSNAGGGATFLDLAMLGGQGSVLIEGLGFGQADASDFIL